MRHQELRPSQWAASFSSGFALFAPYPIAKSSPNSILRVWCQPTVMKKILVLAIVLVAINQWDTNFNHGTLTRAGFSLARALGQAFGI